MKLRSFFWMLLGILSAGCSPSAEKRITGTWQGVDGIQMTLVFDSGGSFVMKIPASPALPFPTQSTGSYSVSGSGEVQILEGGERYVGKLKGDELVMVRAWGGGVSTRFRKDQ